MSKLHSVRLNRDLCMGCTNCIKKCPTEAIRVRSGKAVINEARCIDCGECIRVCPHHAKSAEMDLISRMAEFKYTIALAAPSLYTQFGPPATREMVLAAIKALGFDMVYEVALGAEIVTRQTALYMKGEGRSVKPLISSACPAVVRLIQTRYPGLIPNLVPYDSPMEVTAKMAREEALQSTGLATEAIGVFFISPCPAKRTAINNPIGRSSSLVDGAIAISEVYPLILAKLEKADATIPGFTTDSLQAGHRGVRWSAAGGEARSLRTDKYLAVDGIHNVIAILEEVENERLRDIDFIEANSCVGGCIGGPLTVANRFSGKARHRHYIEAAENLPEQQLESIARRESAVQMEPWPEPVLPNHALQLDEDIVQALHKYEQMKLIAKNLPGLDCGACGAPDCEALAEDIVRGQASETDCIFKLKEKIHQVATQMNDLEIEMNRHSSGGGENHD